VTPRFFKTPADFQRWFAKNHAKDRELLVGFYKKETGKPSITWAEAVDEALCVGWIDGIRKRVDDESYTIRFTPRKPTSTWSAVNIKRVAALENEGRMQPAGHAAFAKRKENKSGIYSYEQRPQELPEPYATRFRKNKKAWAFFESLAPGYRKQGTWWIVSAKQEVTRLARLDALMRECAAGRNLMAAPFTKKSDRTS
jgi:uncharacterized protein YdeI (YjbR/CyaY-like superfamily)